MSALFIGFVAATSFLGFSYSGTDACVMSSIDSLAPLFPPISDGKQVTLREAMRSATFPVLLTPADRPPVEVWLSNDEGTVAFGIESRPDDSYGPRIETIYIKQFDRPRGERDAYLDRSLRELPEASETEISGVRAVVQPTCSAREAQRGLGPQVRTGTLYLYGGTRLSELEDIAQAMLRHAAAFHR